MGKNPKKIAIKKVGSNPLCQKIFQIDPYKIPKLGYFVKGGYKLRDGLGDVHKGDL